MVPEKLTSFGLAEPIAENGQRIVFGGLTFHLSRRFSRRDFETPGKASATLPDETVLPPVTRRGIIRSWVGEANFWIGNIAIPADLTYTWGRAVKKIKK